MREAYIVVQSRPHHDARLTNSGVDHSIIEGVQLRMVLPVDPAAPGET
jgi:hypothetical protein